MLMEDVLFCMFTKSVIDNGERKEFSGASTNLLPGWKPQAVKNLSWQSSPDARMKRGQEAGRACGLLKDFTGKDGWFLCVALPARNEHTRR